MTPVVSVIVANYNYGRYVTEALASVRSQTWADWECLVVDDGSTDDSVSRIEAFCSDRRFRLIRTAHAGQPAAKNAGLRAAHGRHIAFLDADDRWRADKLERQLDLFRRSPELGVVYSRRSLIDVDGRRTGGDDRPFHRGDVLNAIYRDNFVCFSSAMVRRAALERVGYFDERLKLAIDYDWWLRMARFYSFDYVDEPLVEYRTGHANLSRRVGERLDTALGIMARFRANIDVPARLDPRIARRALAETYRHRGIVARGESDAGRRWLIKSLGVRPHDLTTWKALAATLAPLGLRRGLRRLFRRPDWECPA